LTETSASGVKLSAVQGQCVPEGFILDERGDPTTDATEFPAEGHLTHDSQMARGSLVPLGAGHKAYALIYVVSLLTSVVTDSNFPWEADSVIGGRPADESLRYGSVFMALDPAAFGPLDGFLRRVDEYIDDVKDSPRRDGVDEILYPGERSQRLKRQRRDAGVFLLPASHYDALVELGRDLDLPEQLPARP
jgi:LDH2 family malate/lactate/ureidoglycolate dehydrogenase